MHGEDVIYTCRSGLIAREIKLLEQNHQQERTIGVMWGMMDLLIAKWGTSGGAWNCCVDNESK